MTPEVNEELNARLLVSRLLPCSGVLKRKFSNKGLKDAAAEQAEDEQPQAGVRSSTPDPKEQVCDAQTMHLGTHVIQLDKQMKSCSFPSRWE